MIKHKYFGDVIQDEWDESYSTMVVNIPHFKDSFKIKLVEYDEDFEPILSYFIFHKILGHNIVLYTGRDLGAVIVR